MALKTFNIREEVYSKYSKYCKENGISMSRQVQNFMQWQIEDDEPEARKEYLEKLDKLRKGKFIRVKDFGKRYGLE